MIRLVTTYYNQPHMLARQLHEWHQYEPHVKDAFRFVVADDGSQWAPASNVIEHCPGLWLPNVELLRIDEDIPWNQHGARNLAAHLADPGDWLLMLDIDHVLTAENAETLACHVANIRGDDRAWFKFPRERIGRADPTRRKDAIPNDAVRGPVRPALNCYLTTRETYWEAGGYNEDFCGVYGGDTQFLNELRAAAGEPVELSDVTLQVHTRDSVPDANEATLDRDPAPFRERLRDARAASRVRGHDPIRFKWRRVL